MAKTVEVVVDNTELTERAIKRAILKSLEEIGLLAEGYAKKRCPVDTGRLRNSITHAVEDGENTAYIGTNVEYARYVEVGTSRQKAQPYLRPAARDHANQYRSVLKVNLENA